MPKVYPPQLEPVYLALEAFVYGYPKQLPGEKVKSLPVLETLLYLHPLSRRAAEEFADRYLAKHHSKIDYELVGSAFLSLGDLELAERYTKEMLKLFPNEPDYLNTYAYIRLLREGKKAAPEALKLLQKALKLKPNSPAILDSMGWAYYLMGNYTAAENYLKRALKLYPEDPVENYHYAALLIKTGKPCEAKRYLKRALEGIYLLPVEPEPGLEKKVKKLLEEVKRACQTP
ncbi:MAG TPA: tetratricopeptide repeat protein [Aquifex sp.]|nr:tetratricopeptide repeat protein [Aquifex sp.]